MEPSAIQLGAVVDRYTVEAVLGEGGMAVVYRVRHNVLGTVHAQRAEYAEAKQAFCRAKELGSAAAAASCSE